MSRTKQIGILAGVIAAFVAMVLFPTYSLPIFGLALSGGIGYWLYKKYGSATSPRVKNSFSRHDAFRVTGTGAMISLALAADLIVGLSFIGLLLLLLVLFWLLPYWPGLVQRLANEPNENRPRAETHPEMTRVQRAQKEANVDAYKPSTFALFTFIKPGRIKAIVRGQRFMRFIMRFDGMTFIGDLKRGTDKAIPINRREYWDVKTTPEDADDSHPIPRALRKGKLDMLWLWSRHVYNLTGAVFTGIPPFQTVEVYELEQLVKVISSERDEEGEFRFVSRKDVSDHVRAAEFQFFVQIPSAETNDQVKVQLQFGLTVMCVNPYRTFYDTDNRWASRLLTAVAQEVSTKVRTLGYKEVIAADPNDPETWNQLIGPIMALNSKTKGKKGKRDAKHGLEAIGLYIKEAELFNADVFDPKLAAALADVAQAKADKEARQLRADAEKYAVDTIAAAAARHGTYGHLALQVEGNVRTAAAATKNGGDVILNIGAAQGEAVDPKTAFLKKSITGGGSE